VSTELPYTWTDEGAELTVDALEISVYEESEPRASRMNVPRGNDAVALAEAVLAAGGVTSHAVIAERDRLSWEQFAVENAARSMRTRAAEVSDAWSESHGVADTSDYIGSAIRALPLLPDGVAAHRAARPDLVDLPAEDLVEPGDEVPTLAELYGRVTDLEELTASQADLLERHSRALEPSARKAPEEPARYRDRHGDLWERADPFLYVLVETDGDDTGGAIYSRPLEYVRDTYGPLTPVTDETAGGAE
jgi:hypothetical protein